MSDHPEADELERAAEARLRAVDANPADCAAAAAAALLQRLADELRADRAAGLLGEYRCICNWLAESGEIDDLAALVQGYNRKVGITETPADAEAYMRALLGIAKREFGAQ